MIFGHASSFLCLRNGRRSSTLIRTFIHTHPLNHLKRFQTFLFLQSPLILTKLLFYLFYYNFFDRIFFFSIDSSDAEAEADFVRAVDLFHLFIILK